MLKPLHGDEELLAEALGTICRQTHGPVQVVFGVQSDADPAREVAEGVRVAHPDRDTAMVVDSTAHGRNRKIGNLINMLPATRHGTIVIADSDIHHPSDCLTRVAADLARPGVGLVTLPYAGLPANRGWPAALGASGITHMFLPGALLGRAMGRQDALGATMALRRTTLDAIGGLPALADHLADDQQLGRLVAATGARVVLGSGLVLTTVAETTWRALFSHEVRWGRTVRSVAPVPYALSLLQFSTLPALLLPWWAFLLAWAARVAVVRALDRTLGLPTCSPAMLIPLRDALSVLVWAAAHLGRRVAWRGQVMHTDRFRAAPDEVVP